MSAAAAKQRLPFRRMRFSAGQSVERSVSRRVHL